MKRCPKCKTEKNKTEFSKNRTMRDGLQGWCKQCCSEIPITPERTEYKNRWRIENKDRIKDYPAWRRSERGKEARRTIQKKRKTSLRGVEATLTTDEWRETLSDYGNHCVYCNQKSDKLQQDHIVPVSRGGGHTKDNVVPACGSCNSSKGNKPLLVWMWQRI